MRALVRETTLSPSDLIAPIFVTERETDGGSTAALPGLGRLSQAEAVNESGELAGLGVPAVLLFGVPTVKDREASAAYAEDGLVQNTIRAIKSSHPELLVITDVCLCSYTDHGHCGVLRNDGRVDNEATLPLLEQVAVSHAQAGADLVAPSDMMDGRVGAIRAALDRAGFTDTPILSYAAKLASAFYGPFREAADSTPSVGDRRSYQLDPANGQEALREALLDVEEGADMLMVKPALSCLDLVYRIKQKTQQPLAAYHVSGEYGMLKAAAAAGYLDEKEAVLEALLSMRRAGADLIVTYYAKEVARWLS